MLDEHVETLREGYRAWSRGDAEAVLAVLDPDIVWVLPEGGLHAGTFRGHEDLRKFLEGYFDAFEWFRMDPERIVDAGDRIVVLARGEGRGRGSGVEVRLRPAHVWTMGKAGTAVRLEVFTEWDRALSSVGQV